MNILNHPTKCIIKNGHNIKMCPYYKITKCYFDGISIQNEEKSKECKIRTSFKNNS